MNNIKIFDYGNYIGICMIAIGLVMMYFKLDIVTGNTLTLFGSGVVITSVAFDIIVRFRPSSLQNSKSVKEMPE